MNKIILHTLAWAIFLIVPILGSIFNQEPLHLPTRDLVRIAILAIVFYANYFWLIPKMFLKGQRSSFIFINVAFAIGLHFGFQLLIPGPMPNPPPGPSFGHKAPHGHPKGFLIFGALTIVTLTTGMAVAIRLTEMWIRDQKLKGQMETEHLKSELSYLKLQLSPHFLFNTLNNIYSLVMVDQDKAQKQIHHLSKLLRYLLYETNTDHVPIHGEVAFLSSYIELMALRTADRVKVESNFEVHDSNIPIAPLLLLPLIENAFKHGIHPTDPCKISFTLKAGEGGIEFHSENSNHPKSQEDQSGSGLGLANLKKRLDLIYPRSHWYQARVENQVYSVHLTLQVEKSHG